MNVKGCRRDSSETPGRRTRKSGNTFLEELNHLKDKNLLRKLTFLESSGGAKIKIKGRRFINFSSNDYLNLSGHPQIINSAEKALRKYGLGSGASRLLSGTFYPHNKLEERIAKFKNVQAALVFNSGYAANTGIIPSVAGEGDEIFSDQLNHASIIDGIRLSGAAVKVYRHRDTDHLELLLKQSVNKKRAGRRLIITDTVFSMDGDIAPLKELSCLSERYESMLMIDDAHGTGVLGAAGRGGLEHFGMKSGNIIQMGTLSKAAGCYGAFVAGKKSLIDLLINRARSFIYSTSLPPAVAAAGTSAVDIIENRSSGLRKILLRNTRHLADGLRNLGYDTLGSETPIIPILAGDSKRAMKIARQLYRNGIFAPAIRPPTVEDNKCRIRFSVTAGHTETDIDAVLDIMKQIK